MPIGAQRWALAAIVVLLLVSIPSSIGTAMPTTGNTINVQVTLQSGFNAPPGVTVTLTAAGTGQSCSTTTTSSGGAYVSFGQAQGCTLVPGWYTAEVAPQIDTAQSTQLAILPTSTNSATTFYASQATLSAGSLQHVSGLTQLVMNQTVTGWVNETAGVHDANSATVEVLDPMVPGFVLASGTAVGGSYTLHNVPVGSWTLYSSGDVPGSVTNTLSYNYTSVSIVNTRYVSTHWENLTLGSYLVQGNVLPDDHFWYYNQTNLTLWDTATGHLYSFDYPQGIFQETPSNYFEIGNYPNAAGHFLLLVSPQGEGTSWTYFNSLATTAGAATPINFPVSDLYTNPATTEDTTLSYAGNFSAVNVTSAVTLTNDSVFTHLPNANLGDLYAQVAMDFGGSGQVNATGPEWTSFVNWLNASGPIYPANEMDLMTNTSSFLENARYQWTGGATPADLNFDSSSSYTYQTSEQYNLTKIAHPPKAGYPSYTITMGFAYPTAGQSLQYTVKLPRDYTLEANSPVPNGTEILPSSAGNYTTFTLVPLHSPTGSVNGTATFTIDRLENVTAVVNVNSPNFAFSNKTNVINQTHDNYQVLVGLNQNVSFSSIDSVFPTGFNATSYVWNFGDGSTMTTYRENTTAWHYYAPPPTGTDTPGAYHASLTLTSNAGQVSTQDFTVFVDNTPPSPVITTNDTHVKTQTNGNTSWAWLNWSQGIQLNATGSNSTYAPNGGSPVGTLSDAIWNISAGPTYYTQNYSIGAKAASVFGNVSYEFLGAGNNTKRTVNVIGQSGAIVYTAQVHGWVYRVVLTLYDAGGNMAQATLWVFVNDTEKPVSIGAVQGGVHFNPSSGVAVNQTSEIALRNQTCNVQLNQWSYAPGNGTISSWSWEVTNPSNSSLKTRWFNQTTSYAVPQFWVTVPVAAPGSTASSTAYTFTLNVTDPYGNNESTHYTFSCELNPIYSPILQALNTTISGGTTLTDGNSYSVTVNIVNAGGNASIANGTVVTFYYQTSSGTGRTNFGGADQWYNTVDGVPDSNTTAANAPSVNIWYNTTYQAEVHFTPSSSLSGQYQVCANATSTNEFAGSYKTGANVYCVTVTFNQSPLTEWIIAGVVVAVVAAVLIVVLLVLRRRTKGPSKKGGSSGKKGKADEDEDEDEDRGSKAKSSGKGKDDDDEDDDA